MMTADRAIRGLICEELEQLRPGMETAEAEAAERLRIALAELEKPQETLAEIDGQITYAEAELSTWKADLGSGAVPTRVTARTWVTEWESELAALRNKRRQADEYMVPLITERDSAKKALRAAQLDIAALDENKKVPYLGRGRFTASYQAFRASGITAPLIAILQAGDDSHGEWDVAIDLMDDLSQASKYRTDDLSERLLQKARSETQAEFARDPEPVPSGREIVDSELISMEVASVNRALENTPSRIDDYRSPIGALPRNDIVRDALRVPKVPDEMRTH
jgi:hypothetical protein